MFCSLCSSPAGTLVTATDFQPAQVVIQAIVPGSESEQDHLLSAGEGVVRIVCSMFGMMFLPLLPLFGFYDGLSLFICCGPVSLFLGRPFLG